MTKKSDNAQLSVVLPKPLKGWVQQQARNEGINAAAWVRRLVMAEKDRRAA
jgi:hypothetical protein